MALETTRAGRAGRWRRTGIFAVVAVAFTSLQVVTGIEAWAQPKAPTKKQVSRKATKPIPGDNEADKLNEKWLTEHNKREAEQAAVAAAAAAAAAAATASAQSTQSQAAALKTTAPEPDDERVSSVPSAIGPVGPGARTLVAGSVVLVSAGSPANLGNALPGGADLPVYKDLTRAFAGFAPNAAKVELVKGTTGDGFTRVLYANVSDGATKRTYWWFAPPDQPEGWFDEEGRRLGGTMMGEPRPGARVSSPFGVRRYYGRRTGGGFHNGIDFEGKTGEPIVAAADGVITHQNWYFNYGRTVKLSHADNFETLYAHMSRFVPGLRVGSQVRKGDIIGFVGSTGRSTGPHLHFSAIINGQFVDPMPYLSSQAPSLLSSGAQVVFRQWQLEVRAAVEVSGKARSHGRYPNLQGNDDWSRNPFSARNLDRL
ncbi:MAG: M23 family metallopeptidase [Enhydrobacter sp.]|nr:MAG: M23 family metallopeptidase [Enhydrobacter sp.]